MEDYQSPWKTILDKRLSPVRGSFVLHCNFDKSKVNLQIYHKKCFDAWSELHAKEQSSSQDIINEIIWNNRFICIDKKSIYMHERHRKPELFKK